MRIQHNIMAMGAYRNYTNNVNAMKKNLEKLSSGYKINRAGDDAAGLAISEKMRAQITGLETAQKNAKDGISLVQTAEGALTEVHDMLNRMVTLATQSANGTYDNDVDRVQLQKELVQLRSEIDRIADSSNFNGIKLLDGSLGQGGLTVEEEIGASETNFTQGITIKNGENGGGTQGSFTLDITKPFGFNDKLDITFDANGNTDAAATALAAAAKTLTFGSDFTGTTADEQAASIADALKSDSNVTAHFTVEAKGSQVVLTNIKEGNDQVNVANIAAQGANVTAGIDSTNTKLTAGTGGAAPAIKFANLAKATGGWDFSKGDTLTFEIDDINGKTWTAELKIDDKVFGGDHDTTVDNIVKALSGTLTGHDGVTFKDVNGTVLDESKFKFQDMFTVTEDGTDLTLTATDEGIRFAGGTSAKIKTDNTSVTGGAAGLASTQVTARTAGTNEKYEIRFDTGTKDANLSHGDKLTLNGKLADGRTFSIDMVAGVDYTIGSNMKGTMDNLVSALQNGNGIQVILKGTDADGNETTDQVKSTDIFGSNKELKLTAQNGGLDIEGTVGGKASAGKKLSAMDATTPYVFTPADVGAGNKTLVNGAPQTQASSTVTFSEGLQNGSTIKVGDGTYEIVADAADVKDGNIAVVVAEADLIDGSKVAKAFADAVNMTEQAKVDGQTDDNGVAIKPAIQAKVAGNEVTLTTRDVGTAVAAPKIDAVGGTKPAVEFTLDPKKLTAESYVKINGNKYQFVNSENARVAEGVTRVVVADTEKATSKDLGDALAAAVAAKDPDTAVEVDDNGLVTVSDAVQNEDGSWTKPAVGFYNGKGGLRLQIGETAESWNQLKVNIRDTHCDSLGKYDEEGNLVGMNLSQISILNQDDAAKAIDVVKAAINTVSDIRGTLGATQNRLDHTINNLSVMQENIQDAESTIRDTDVAAEMMEYTKNNILIQSAQAMLAQANQVPQGVLQLLQ